MRHLAGVTSAVICLAIGTGCGGLQPRSVGRSGVDTIRVVTVPEGATLQVNGKSIGLTPQSVPQAWEKVGSSGETLSIVLEKEGYETVKQTITYDDTVQRYWREEFSRGSEFGRGDTYIYTFQLKSLK